MALPLQHPRAVFWGIERQTGENGGARWEQVHVVPPGAGPERAKWVAWFPMDQYNEQAIRVTCGPGTYRIRWQPQSRKAKWPPSDPFTLEPAPIPMPAPSPPQPQPAPPPTPPAPPPVQPPPPPTALATRPEAPSALVPAPIRHGQPGVSGDVVGGFERLHHLASSDAGQVVTAIATLAGAFQTAVTQMAAVTIASTSQRAADAQQMVQALMAQAAAPNPQLAAIAQQLQQQNAAIGALAAAQAATTAQIAELEEEEEQTPGALTTIAEPSDGQKIMATLAPLAIEYGPRIAAKLWPDAPKLPPMGDGTDMT